MLSITRSLAKACAGAVLLSGALLISAAPASATTCPYPGTNCQPPSPTPTSPPPPTVADHPTSSSTLPFTGGDVAGLAAIGAGAVLAGVVFVRQSRRNHVDVS